jgi:formamidopyrimidine-DNA glycosylase
VPELPEVDTVRRNVEAALVGRALISVSCTLPKLLRDSPIPDFDVLVGHRLVSARRRAKVLEIAFDNDLSMLIHLKLAGQFAILRSDGTRLVAGHPVPSPTGPYPHKTTHVTLTFDDGSIAYLSDVRQFGWVRIMPSADVATALETFGFGPEANAILDQLALGRVFARRGIPVKTLLLDQTFIAGLGNIYVDEVLFRAGVHPARTANKLAEGQRRAILDAIGPVIAEGIRQGGATIIRQRAIPDGNFPAVHGREGEACFNCGTPVLKTRIGGRGTYFCPTCQKPPRATRAGVASGRASSGTTGGHTSRR